MIKRDKLGRFVKGSYSSTEIKKGQCKGEKNPMYGKNHTKKAKEKIREKSLGNKKWLGKKHKEESKKKMSKFREGKTYEKIFGSKEKAEKVKKKIALKSIGHVLPKESRERLSEKRRGNKNPAWLDGRSFEPYSQEFNKEIKEQIRKRDNYRCQADLGTCKGRLSIHHIDYNKKNNSPLNLITLCARHNTFVNKYRKHWINYFKMKIFIRMLFNPQKIVIYNETKKNILETKKQENNSRR